MSKVDDGKVYLGSSQDVLDEDGKPVEQKAIMDKDFEKLTDEQKIMPIAVLQRKDDRDAAGDLFVPKHLGKKKQRAAVLKSKIEDYRDFVISLAGNNQNLIDKINIICDVSDRGSGNKKQSWEIYNFVDMPSVGALTILSKIQLDLRNIEADVIDFLKINIDAKSLKFTSAEGIQIPQSNFVLRGDPFRAEIFITAMNENQNPDVYVGDYDSLGN